MYNHFFKTLNTQLINGHHLIRCRIIKKQTNTEVCIPFILFISELFALVQQASMLFSRSMMAERQGPISRLFASIGTEEFSIPI